MAAVTTAVWCGVQKSALSVYSCHVTGMKSVLTAEVPFGFEHPVTPALVYLLCVVSTTFNICYNTIAE